MGLFSAFFLKTEVEHMILDINTKIISGRTKKDSISSNMVKKSRRILLVADPSADPALVNTVNQDILSTGADCVLFKDIPLKPTSRVIENITDVILKGYVQTVAAVGGVKTLNIAKTAAAAAKSGLPVDDILDNQSVPYSKSDLDYIEIPSALRNPLMFTPYSAVVDGRNRSVKYINTGVTPSLVISDPDLYDSLSSIVFDSIVFEVVLSCFEGLASLKKSYFSDSLYKCVLNDIFKTEYGIKTDRASDTALSACIAQAVTGPGIGFFMSWFLNSRSTAPKSVLCVILMPWILEWYFKRYPVLIETVNAVVPGGENMNSEDFLQFLRKRISMKGLPLRLSEAGVNKNIYPYVLSSLPLLNSTVSLPAEISESEISEILRKAY